MTPSRNLAEYYRLEETNGDIRIYLHSGMGDRLQAEILRAADAGTEAGGILLGRIEEDQGKRITVIDDFVPVSCSYRDGPLYTLGDEDTPKVEAALLRAALAGCESPDAPSILGYYRSHMRDGLGLSPDDLLLIDSYFQSPSSVFLIVKPLAGAKTCTAGFFFLEDGIVQSEFSSLEVALGRSPALPPAACEARDLNVPDVPDAVGENDLPDDLAALFRRAALGEPSVAARARAPEPGSAVQAAVMAGDLARPGKAPGARQALPLRAATISIAALALFISVAAYLSGRPQREEAAAYMPAGSALGLQAEPTPPHLRVTWNRNAREIATARRATLSISIGDGKAESSVDLNEAELAAGNYLFTVASDNIRLRLEVYGVDDGSVAQSIRVSFRNPR